MRACGERGVDFKAMETKCTLTPVLDHGAAALRPVLDHALARAPTAGERLPVQSRRQRAVPRQRARLPPGKMRQKLRALTPS